MKTISFITFFISLFLLFVGLALSYVAYIQELLTTRNLTVGISMVTIGLIGSIISYIINERSE